MRRVLCCVGLGLWLSGTGLAAAERPADFAYGLPLTTDEHAAFHEVVVPPEVYAGVTRADLGDLRVFNGAGEAVPFAWRRVEGAVQVAAPITLPLFPLIAGDGSSVDDFALRVRQTTAGTTIDIAPNNETQRGTPRIVVGYLLDVSAVKRGLRAIAFDWPVPPNGFAGRARVEASDDLASWRVLVNDAPLVSLDANGQQLRQQRIELPGQRAKYLRLSWLTAPATAPRLTAARGEPLALAAAAPRAWLTREATTGPQAGEYLFDFGGAFPADRARVELPQLNTVVQVELLTRDDGEQPWRPVVRGVQYRLRQDDGEIASPALSLPVSASRYWLLKVDARGGGLGGSAPQLTVGWIPPRLVFATRGAGPFMLAYGNRDAAPTAYAMDTLIPADDSDPTGSTLATRTAVPSAVRIAPAVTGERVMLGGEGRRVQVADWKRFSLWGVLFAGVLVLGAMAWRLVRELRRDQAQAPPPV